MPLFQLNSLQVLLLSLFDSSIFFFDVEIITFKLLMIVLSVFSLTVSLFPLATKQLSPNAIKDYNRGRAYLADLANSSGVAELFTSVKEAVTQYIKLQSSNNSSSLSSSLLSTSLSLSSSMSSPSQTNAWHELQCRQGRGIGSNHQF